mgnify:CR=1 FL=1
MKTLVKSNKTRYPWLGPEFSNFFGKDDFFNDRFWQKDMMEKPAINVREIDDYYLVELAAPGLSKKDFEIKEDGERHSYKPLEFLKDGNSLSEILSLVKNKKFSKNSIGYKRASFQK